MCVTKFKFDQIRCQGYSLPISVRQKSAAHLGQNRAWVKRDKSTRSDANRAAGLERKAAAMVKRSLGAGKAGPAVCSLSSI
jgi:hypothetical protein